MLSFVQQVFLECLLGAGDSTVHKNRHESFFFSPQQKRTKTKINNVSYNELKEKCCEENKFRMGLGSPKGWEVFSF